MKLSIMRVLVTLSILLSVGRVYAQNTQPTSLSDEEAKQANNPLANIKALNFQNYNVPSIYENASFKANSFLLRYSQPLAGGKVLIRATLPFSTVPTGIDYSANTVNYSSGLGDFNLFATYVLTKPTAKTLIGLGPQLVIPTATSVNTGAGKWQLGAAFLVYAIGNPLLQCGALITYQASIAGPADRNSTSVLIAQPFFIFQIGKGFYLRSTALWNFDLENNAYNVPMGIGGGKVVKVGKTVINLFMEPQFTILHQGYGQPATQIFAGINCQF